MRPAGWASFLPVAAALAGLAAAAASSIRTGLADYRMRQETVAATRAAIALTPDQAEYYARLAFLVSDDDPPEAADALRRAVALNPWDASSWIELGLQAEAAGDAATSLHYLLRAADVDKKFLPRWTLANYYFRRGDTAMFWLWARQAAAMVYGDPQPLFRLCGKLIEDGNLLDRLDIRNPEVRAAYLSYLMGANRMDLIGPALHRLLDQNRLADTPLLLYACDRLLDARRVPEAAQVWNRLADAGRVPFKTPAGEGEQLIANGSFLAPPASRGFDWRLPGVEGIGASLEESQGLRVTFSGRQPEDCEALVQFVPVHPKTRYQLLSEYRTHGIPSGAGLAWRFADARAGTAPPVVIEDGPSLASEADAEARLVFETPAECRLVRLALRYRRTPGTTRMEGFLILRNVALRPVAVRGAAPEAPAQPPPIEGSRVRK